MTEKFGPTYYLEGITHQVGILLRDAMEQLGAQSVTCFIGHENSAGDLRLVYAKGVDYPESLYSVLSRRSLRQYNDVAGSKSRFVFQAYAPQPHDLYAPLHFCGTSIREKYTGCLQRLWRTGGCPDAMVFFNFRRPVRAEILSDPRVQTILEDLERRLVPKFEVFWATQLPQEFAVLKLAAESIGGRIFFEVKDFEMMSRAARNRAFIDLLEATIKADPLLGEIDCWWNLYVPHREVPKNALDRMLDVKLVKIKGGGPANISPAEIPVAAFDTVESWCYWRDCALRFSPQRIASRQSGFQPLLEHPYLSNCKAMVCVPFTSGDTIFAIATLGVSNFGDHDKRKVTAAQNRMIRSLWFNGRRISWAWSQASDRRHAESLRRIFDKFLSKADVDDWEHDRSTKLSNIFCTTLGAAECNMWERTNGEFHALSVSSNSRSRTPPRPDGFSWHVMNGKTPILLMIKSDGSAPVQAQIFRMNRTLDNWTEVTGEELKCFPKLRDVACESGCRMQLALPLQISGESENIGVVWLHFRAESLPEHLDVDLAMSLAGDISKVIVAGRDRRSTVEKKVEKEKKMEYERVLTHLRHETLKQIPDIIRNAARKIVPTEQQASPVKTILDVSDLLETSLLMHTTMETTHLAHLKSCNVVDAVSRGLELSALARQGNEPEVVFEKSLLDVAPIAKIDRRLLWGILLNLISNSRTYRFEGLPPHEDETIRVSVKATSTHILIIIDDAGTGMSPEQKALAGVERFKHDPFRGNQGAGMGLLISRTALRGFGDWEIADSARGGTVFTLLLERA